MTDQLHPIKWGEAWIGLPETVRRDQIASARLRGLPEFVPDVETVRDEPLAIIAGGPSLKTTLAEAKGMRTMVCGSSHDYVIGRGLIPDYVILCDAGKIVLRYLEELPNWQTLYMVASQCAPCVFDRLIMADANVMVWHALHSTPDTEGNADYWIKGGNTTSLRALYLAYLMGYRDVHLFGMDSCYSTETHAYDAAGYSDENAIDVFTEDGTKFRCQPYMALQAETFMEMLPGLDRLGMELTIHGPGLIAHMVQLANAATQDAA